MKKMDDIDHLEDLFMMAWDEENYVPGRKYPEWVEIRKEDFREVLLRFVELLAAANSRPAAVASETIDSGSQSQQDADG